MSWSSHADADDLASQARQFLGGFEGESGQGGSIALQDLGGDASADVGQTGSTSIGFRDPGGFDDSVDPFQPTAGQQVRPTEFGGTGPNEPIQMQEIDPTGTGRPPTQLSQTEQ